MSMPDRTHFIEIPPPEVAWVLGGPADGDAPAAAAGRVEAGGEALPGGRSPVAGGVGRVAVRTDTRGRRRWAAPVAAEEVETPTIDSDALPRGASLAEIAKQLDLAGVRADRHNSPDLAAQLAAASRRPIDAVVCHALEADPTLPVQREWGLLHAAEVRRAVLRLRRATGAARAILCVPDGDARAWVRAMRDLRREAAPAPDPAEEDPAAVDVAGLRVEPVPNAYPQADPTLLAHSLLRRRLRPGGLPTEAGAVVLDAIAAAAVGAAIAGRWPTAVPIAVRDHRRDLSVLAVARRGTTAADVLLYLGLTHARDAADAVVRAGDFLRDTAIPPEAVLDGEEVVLHVAAPAAAADPDPCVRCGWCLEICPTGVQPPALLDAIESADAAAAMRGGAGACVGCGLCSLVCPSRLPLRRVSLAARDLARTG